MSIHSELNKNLKFNFTVNLLDGAFFGLGFGFASLVTVLPLFVANLTDSAMLIGVIPAVHNMGWMLPQLLTARSVSRMKRFKPAVMIWTTQERLPFLVLGILSLFIADMNKTAALVITFALLIWQGLSAGMTANPWQNMIGKIIPSNMRGTFFGSQSAAANLLGSGGALAAGFFLETKGFPRGFTWAFFSCAASMAISMVALASTREPERAEEPLPTELVSFWGNVRHILHTDRDFRWFIIGRFMFQFGTMASAFYTVYAVNKLGMNTITAGAMTSVLFIVQVASNLLFGWIADRIGRLPVLRIGAASAVIATLIAYLAPSANWFFAVMIFSGAALSTFWTIGIVFSLEFGSDSDRPTYVGLSNTLVAPAAILAPLLGGWIADTFSYQHTFLASFVFALIVLAIMLKFVKSPP